MRQRNTAEEEGEGEKGGMQREVGGKHMETEDENLVESGKMEGGK